MFDQVSSSGLIQPREIHMLLVGRQINKFQSLPIKLTCITNVTGSFRSKMYGVLRLEMEYTWHCVEVATMRWSNPKGTRKRSEDVHERAQATAPAAKVRKVKRCCLAAHE
eukprot:1158952-Pelagomonas_calceolata.AAC.8